VTYKFAASDDGGASTYVFPSTGKQGDVDAICFPSTCTPDGKNMLLINGQQIRCQTGVCWPTGSHLVGHSSSAPCIASPTIPVRFAGADPSPRMLFCESSHSTGMPA
jgi:hypothetical protein